MLDGRAPSPERESPEYERLVRWTRIFSAYFTAQTGAQVLSLLAGLVLIRFLPVTEYALYTMAASVISFFTFASDLGSTTSLVYFFRRAQSEGEDFAPYRQAVVSMRRAAFLAGAVAVAAVFPLWATSEGFAAGQSLAVAAAILATVWFQIGAAVRLLGLRLAGEYGRSYRAELAGAGLRLVLALVVVAVARQSIWLAVATSAASLALVTFLARPSKPEAALPPAELAAPRRKLLRYLLPTLPSALYFSVQGPLLVWLAATFGEARNVAEVGALGRLGLVLSLVNGLSGTIFLPHLAHLTDEGLYRRRFLQFGALLGGIAALLFVGTLLFPELLLGLLGSKYSGLTSELYLVVGTACLMLLESYLVMVCLARSWTRWQALGLVVQIAAQAAMVALLPLATTAGVLRFNFLTAVVALVFQTLTVAAGFLRPRWVHWA